MRTVFSILVMCCTTLVFIAALNYIVSGEVKQSTNKIAVLHVTNNYAIEISTLSTDTEQAHTGMDVTLCTPLNTFTAGRRAALENCTGIECVVIVPDDAPADLGVGAYLKDQDGHWFQSPHKKQLLPGKQQLFFPIHALAHWQAEPNGLNWDAFQLNVAKEFGLYFWSAEKSSATIRINHLRAVPNTGSSTENYRCDTLQIQHLDNFDAQSGHSTAQTGERWELHCSPLQMPKNPYDASTFKIDAVVTGPIKDGEKDAPSRSFPVFYEQAITLSDGGDAERASSAGPAHYTLRLRPQKAGRYHIQLRIQSGTYRFDNNLPDLIVSGTDFNNYIKVDSHDKRFFKSGDKENDEFFFPLGINLRSVNDSRGHENTPCIPTPTRGSLSYDSYLQRYSKAGANCAEIWMCSWNLALEWKQGWPGFYGAGYYNQENATRLDRILDIAHENNMRVILVLNNHGQASSRVDSEWDLHPYNRRNGGFLRRAHEVFTNQRARQAQDNLRRYIIARYADHPAIMCWKLWTEQDLTDVGMQTRNPQERRTNTTLRKWHEHACADFKKLDHYQHPIVTHWSSNYNYVDRSIAAIPDLDAVFIDAYHYRVRGHQLLANLLMNSTTHSQHGLHVHKKPILCTEFGGTPLACPEPQLLAEHLSGPWAAMFSGHAGSPLLWWFEWVDQKDLWQPYRAVSQFLNGEDLRGEKKRSVTLQTKSTQRLWNRSWATSGLALGYLLDQAWGYDGINAPLINDAKIKIGNNVTAGVMRLEWWDASLGTCIQEQLINHKGGALEIAAPPFRRHLAFKLKRQ